MFRHILRTYSRYKLLLRPDHAELVNHDGTKFTVVKRGRLYFLGICDGAVTCDCTNYACDVSDWHEILGHCNYDDILKLERIVDGMKVTGKSEKPGDCSACLLGKMTQGRSRKPRARATVPLELVHTDLAGPIEPVSTEGFKYAISFTDDYSGVVFVYFLKSKSDTLT